MVKICSSLAMDLLQIQGSTVFKLEYKLNMYIYIFFWVGRDSNLVRDRDGSLEDRGRARDLILMASVLVAHVSLSEVPGLSTGSREPASVSRPASRPNLDGLGLGLGLGHPCLGLGLGLGGPGLDYNPVSSQESEVFLSHVL